MNWKKLFKRKRKDSPYYGEQLFSGSALPLRRDDEEPKPAPVRFTPTKKEPLEPDWELRRFELAKMIVAQERRSVA